MAYLLTVSGLRGIVGRDLMPDVVLEYSAALATLFGPDKTYIVGRDTRPHGPTFRDAAIAGITAVGGDVIDVGIVPTPTLLFNVRNWIEDTGGGIVITASHNPIEWNALKFVRPDGLFLFQKDVEKLIEIYERKSWEWKEWDGVGRIEEYAGAIDNHINAVVTSDYLDLDSIMDAGLKVAIDAVNGANWFALPALMNALGTNVIRLNCEPTGIFPHVPEPRREHLEDLNKILESGAADLGFATDPDGDRLLAGIKGRGLLTEEHTIAIAAWAVLERYRGPIVVNLSTSMMVEDVARHFNVPVYRTKVGEANVVEGIFKYNAVIGGEGNGGVILPDINPTRDSLVGAALITQLAVSGELEHILSHLGNYTMLKGKMPRKGDFNPEDVIAEFPDSVESNTIDGAYIRFDSAWIHMRPSNTEPIVRIYVEADSGKRARELMNRALAVLKKLQGET